MVAASGQCYQLVTVSCGNSCVVDSGGFDLLHVFRKYGRIGQIGVLIVTEAGIALRNGLPVKGSYDPILAMLIKGIKVDRLMLLTILLM